jgi:DNA-binding CsgD family transcriptional regulator
VPSAPVRRDLAGVIAENQSQRSIAARVRGTVAIRIVGELVTRLASGDGWDFAAFGRDDEVIVTGSSTHNPADIAALRPEVRLQRFAGTALPHVSTALGSEQRRSLFVIFGEFGDRVAILRIVRGALAKPFVPRDGAGIERFFRQHADAIAASIFDVSGDDSARVAARRAAPIAFTIDTNGALLSTVDEPPDDVPSLRTQLLPRNGEVPTVLRSVISELLERYHGGADSSELVSILPFALVRLAPLRAHAGPAALLVTVEWLRSRASLEVTAAQYSISKRELQVLSAMLRGAAVAEIAAELSISESTVVFHLKRMLKKTLSKNRTELAARMLGWEISAAG